MVSDNITEYIPSIGRIYREAFPHHALSLLGQSTCERYFRLLSEHNAHRLIIAVVDGEGAGFVVIQVDTTSFLGRKWLLHSIVPILKFTAFHPLFILGHARRGMASLYNHRKHQMKPSFNTNAVRTPGTYAYTETIAVKRSCRGLGLGKRLVEECIKVGREYNKDRLSLRVDKKNDEAIKLYRAIGFEQRLEPANGRLSLIYRLHE